MALVAAVFLLGTVVVDRVEGAASNNERIAETRRQVTTVDELATQVILAAREPAGPLNTPELLIQRGDVLIEGIEEAGQLAQGLGSSDEMFGTNARVDRLVDSSEGMVFAGADALAAADEAERLEALAVLDVFYRLFRHDLAELRDSLTEVESTSLRTQADGIQSFSRWTIVVAAGAFAIVLLAAIAARRVSRREQSLLTMLRERSITDPLTLLLNRRGFQERAAFALRHQREGAQAALLFLDLDGFKTVNDTLGHQVGDRILQTVGERIDRGTRSKDIVARLGGDEFAVLLRWPGGAGDPMSMAARLQSEISAPIQIGEHRVEIGVSVGLRRIASVEESIEELLRDADVAMYAAKRSRTASIQEFDRSLVDAVLDRVDLEEALRQAVHNDELSVHYQPIFDYRGDLVGAEALVRWFRDERAVYPDQFLPVAKDLGLMAELDHLVLRRATRDIARLNRTFDLDLRVAVNVAPEEAEHRELARRICDALRDSGLRPDQLVIEVTEQGTLQRLDRATEVLEAIRALGVRTALDDFGTGNSSLFFLDKLPIDILKIDRSFLPGRGDDQRRHDLFETIVELGNKLEFDVVAEGVEDARQQGLATSAGCRYLQGYHLGHPTELAMFELIATKPEIIQLSA